MLTGAPSKTADTEQSLMEVTGVVHRVGRGTVNYTDLNARPGGQELRVSPYGKGRNDILKKKKWLHF